MWPSRGEVPRDRTGTPCQRPRTGAGVLPHAAPQTPLHPSALPAGVKDAFHHEGQPPHLPPREPRTSLTKDPTDMPGTGPCGEQQSPFLTSFPLQTVFMYVCKIQLPSSRPALSGWLVCLSSPLHWPQPGSPHAQELPPLPSPSTLSAASPTVLGPILLPGWEPSAL